MSVVLSPEHGHGTAMTFVCRTEHRRWHGATSPVPWQVLRVAEALGVKAADDAADPAAANL
jgi:hypothetical protein